MKALIKGDKSQSKEAEEEDIGPSSQGTQINWQVSIKKDKIVNSP